MCQPHLVASPFIFSTAKPTNKQRSQHRKPHRTATHNETRSEQQYSGAPPTGGTANRRIAARRQRARHVAPQNLPQRNTPTPCYCRYCRRPFCNCRSCCCCALSPGIRSCTPRCRRRCVAASATAAGCAATAAERGATAATATHAPDPGPGRGALPEHNLSEKASGAATSPKHVSPSQPGGQSAGSTPIKVENTLFIRSLDTYLLLGTAHDCPSLQPSHIPPLPSIQHTQTNSSLDHPKLISH